MAKRGCIAALKICAKQPASRQQKNKQLLQRMQTAIDINKRLAGYLVSDTLCGAYGVAWRDWRVLRDCFVLQLARQRLMRHYRRGERRLT